MLTGFHKVKIPSTTVIAGWYRNKYKHNTAVHPHKSDYCNMCYNLEDTLGSLKTKINLLMQVWTHGKQCFTLTNFKQQNLTRKQVQKLTMFRVELEMDKNAKLLHLTQVRCCTGLLSFIKIFHRLTKHNKTWIQLFLSTLPFTKQ